MQLYVPGFFQLGEQELIVFDTPGHTRGHIVYYMPGGDSVFVVRTLDEDDVCLLIL